MKQSYSVSNPKGQSVGIVVADTMKVQGDWLLFYTEVEPQSSVAQVTRKELSALVSQSGVIIYVGDGEPEDDWDEDDDWDELEDE